MAVGTCPFGSLQVKDGGADDTTTIVRNSIRRFGADSVGVYIGTAASLDGAGKWAAERLAHAIGSRSLYSAMSIDTPCKPLVSLLMSGNAGLVPVIDDQRCTLSIFIGSNPVVSHGHMNCLPDPVVRLRHLAAPPRELWVIDTRTTESSRRATRSLMPRPGTDLAVVAAWGFAGLVIAARRFAWEPRR